MKSKEQFNVFYDKLNEKYKSFLEKERKNLNKKIQAEKQDTFILCLLIFGFLDIFFVYIIAKYDNLLLDLSLILFICISILIIIKSFIDSIKSNKTKNARNRAQAIYTKKYKEIIIHDLISHFSNNFSYEAKNGISRTDYTIGGEFEKTNIYHSEDLIKGSLDNSIQYSIAEVHTQNKHTDKEGNTSYVNIFQGVLAKIDTPKPFKSILFIRKHETVLNKDLFIKVNAPRIELDSMEFEKIFDVYGNNKIVALQLLTADIMQELLQFYNDTKIKYEITIKDNSIYLRFPCKNIFEPNITYKLELDRNTIYEHYIILEFTFNIINQIIKTINETEY